MALPALATVSQLEGWMQADPGTLPASAASTLETVSAIVRAEARQSFTRGTSTVTLYPDTLETWGGQTFTRVDLPQRPVVSVASVVDEDGNPVPYELRRDTLHLRKPCTAVSVTFTHGYAQVPGDVLAVALTAAQRVLNNPSDLRQETVGSMSVTYAAETIGASLSQADKDLLARYRRRTAVVRLV